MKILLADDQPRVRFALRVLLEQQPGWIVVAEAVNSDELLVQAAATHPDLTVLDWELPGQVPEKLLPEIRRVCPDLRIVALGEQPEARYAALSAGADAFINRTNPPEQLLTVLKSCMERRVETDGQV
jgi:DNA-binding NarL/FixJ family response regulator